MQDQKNTIDKIERSPQKHRTIERVTRILEEVVYNPGMTFAEIARVSGAAKSSAYGFVNGLLAQGWLYVDNNRYYLGPAVFALTMASGHIRAGLVSHADLVALHEATGLAVFIGVSAGEDLIYIDEAGSDNIGNFGSRSNIRRTLLNTAGGKILLASRSDAEIEAFLRRKRGTESELIDRFLDECTTIRSTGFALNERTGNSRLAMATPVRNRVGACVASLTILGPKSEVEPRIAELQKIVAGHRDRWSERMITPREAI
jgi:DNA-binding IclR family transcriptional regulator